MRLKPATLMCILLALITPTFCYPAMHCVRKGALGGQTGQDWSSAFDELPSALIRGDTYYVADGLYGGYTFDDPESGGKQITIRKATVSDHGTDAGWTASYGQGNSTFSSTLIFVTGNWIIDGQKRNPDGRSGYGFRITTGQGKGISIASAGGNNVNVRYMEIQGVGDDSAATPANDLVYITAPVTNFRIQYSYLHDSGRTHFLFRQADSGLIEYCYMARNESVPAQHSEGISAYVDESGGTDNWIVRYNTWEDVEGTGIIVFSGNGWEIYGNVFFETGNPSYGGTGNGAICTWTGYTVTNTRVYNNTFVDLTGFSNGITFATSPDPGSNAAINNLWYNCSNPNFASVTHDYNFFTDGAHGETHAQQWTAGSNLFVDYSGRNFNLAVPTLTGAYLSAPYDLDLNGSSRGSDGNWDRGAYEYPVGAGARPSPPSKIRIVQ
jgi:hypothetical protein